MFSILFLTGNIGAVLGSSIVGLVSEKVQLNKWTSILSHFTDLTGRELALKTGMLTSAIYPLMVFIGMIILIKNKSKHVI